MIDWPNAETLLELGSQEAAAFLAQAGRITAEQWSRQSPCQEWTALDVLVHLGLGTAMYRRIVENALAGRNEAPWDVPPGENPSAYFKQVHRDRTTEGHAVNLRRYAEAVDQFESTMLGVDDAALAGPTWFYGLSMTLGGALSTRLFDQLVHQSDIRRAVGIAPAFSPAAARYAGNYTLQTGPMFFRPDLLEVASGKVLLHVDSVARLATFGPDGLKLGAPDGSHSAEIDSDGAIWALVGWGRLELTEAVTAGGLRISGERPLAERFVRAFRTP